MHINDLYPVARYHIKNLVRGSSDTTLLRQYHGYETADDLAMDVVEKILKCKPKYLSLSYVKIAARCVCINKWNRKKITSYELNHNIKDEESMNIKLEEVIEGDIHDTFKELEEFIEPFLGDTEKETYQHLLSQRNYSDIAEELGICTRTIERRVHDLKYKLQYILTEEDPLESEN